MRNIYHVKIKKIILIKIINFEIFNGCKSIMVENIVLIRHNAVR